MNLAEYVAQFLTVNGVSRIFGLPGGENVLFIEALRKAGLEFVLFHHEAAAGFAAGVTGQLTDRPGVCLSTVGPGAVNLVAPAAAATLERSPMLAITAEIDTAWYPRVRHMKIDLPRLFGGVVKDSFALNPESVAADLEKAWNLALSPPMGAVHIAIAPDMASSSVSGAPRLVARPLSSRLDDVALARAERYLLQAPQKMIITGIGVEAGSAQAELVELAEAWGTPVAVTPKAKGHFPESHPLFAGCFSAYGDGPLRQYLAEVDVILGVGLDSVDFVTSTWELDTPVVNINLSGADDPALNPVIAVNGNLKKALIHLATRSELSNPREANIHNQIADLRRAIALELYAADFSSSVGTVRVGELIDGLRSALPEDGTVTVDVGVFKLVFLQQWKTDKPKSLFVANGLSAMGYALPGALAIKLEEPDTKVVAVVGDGALLMYAGELATIARQRQPLVILVIVDDALSLIRLKQLRNDVPVHGTEFDRVDFRSLANSFGLEYGLIEGQESPSAVLGQALALNRPVLVEARIDREEFNRFR
ncbi:MAG: thiamine pyrophosphate-binding protein [Candidatus Promineifilaceae bacterium]